MQEIKAPNSYADIKLPSIFLAGSIEMGAAEKWQERVVRELANLDVLILNPRRDDWDSSWKQTPEDKQFREQVEWELDGQENADWIMMWFDAKTKSPITLLELGLFSRTGKLIVGCPEEFYRSGNVYITCERYAIPVVKTLEDLIDVMKARLLRVDSFYPDHVTGR